MLVNFVFRANFQNRSRFANLLDFLKVVRLFPVPVLRSCYALARLFAQARARLIVLRNLKLGLWASLPVNER